MARLGDTTADVGGGGARPVVIQPSLAPAVVATANGRIVDTDCLVQGPVTALLDRSGAYVVTAGAGDVTCPQASVRTGMNLRWPAETPPPTRPG